MIKSVTVTNYQNESLKINLSEAEPEHGLIIKSISGLGPPKANISMTDLASMDGSVFNSARVEKRNIVIQLIFTNALSIEDTRQRTYKYFPIKTPVQLSIETDNRILNTIGYVESNEPDIFSKEESNQISILCDDPYFYSSRTIVTTFSGIEPLFEFEFSNESVTEPLLEFGLIETKRERLIRYDGDAEAGIIITIHAFDVAGDITIYNARSREVMTIYNDKIKAITGSGIMALDDIIISTIKGNKRVELLRNGKYINILNAIDKYSDWFQLKKGDNVFAYFVSFGELDIQFKIENKNLYEGI